MHNYLMSEIDNTKKKSLKDMNLEERTGYFKRMNEEIEKADKVNDKILRNTYSVLGLNYLGGGFYGTEGSKAKINGYNPVVNSEAGMNLRNELAREKLNEWAGYGINETPSISDSDLIAYGVKLSKSIIRQGNLSQIEKILSEQDGDFKPNNSFSKKIKELEGKMEKHQIETGEELKLSKEEEELIGSAKFYRQMLERMYEKSAAISILNKNKFFEENKYLERFGELYPIQEEKSVSEKEDSAKEIQ